jgi:hypothetical protein
MGPITTTLKVLTRAIGRLRKTHTRGKKASEEGMTGKGWSDRLLISFLSQHISMRSPLRICLGLMRNWKKKMKYPTKAVGRAGRVATEEAPRSFHISQPALSQTTGGSVLYVLISLKMLSKLRVATTFSARDAYHRPPPALFATEEFKANCSQIFL